MQRRETYDALRQKEYQAVQRAKFDAMRSAAIKSGRWAQIEAEVVAEMEAKLPQKLRSTGGLQEKLCSSCEQWKPINEFSPGGPSHSGSEGGLHCECKPCNAKRHRDRRAAARLGS